MRYMKLLGLEMMVFAIGATVLFGQGNQEAANLTREGIEASRVKDWDKAIAAFKRAAQLDEHYAPNLASALQQRASLYVSQQKFQEAVADYSEALKIKAKDPDIFERRAYAEMQLKDYDKALHDYNEAIKLSPEEPNTIRCGPSSTKRRAISRPLWPTWTKSSKSIPIIRTRCNENNFWKRNCTHHQPRRQRRPVPFLIQTYVRRPQRLPHRPPGRDVSSCR